MRLTKERTKLKSEIRILFSITPKNNLESKIKTSQPKAIRPREKRRTTM